MDEVDGIDPEGNIREYVGEEAEGVEGEIIAREVLEEMGRRVMAILRKSIQQISTRLSYAQLRFPSHQDEEDDLGQYTATTWTWR